MRLKKNGTVTEIFMNIFWIIWNPLKIQNADSFFSGDSEDESNKKIDCK